MQHGHGCRSSDWPLSQQRLRRLVLASLPADCQSALITLVVVGNAESQRLNRQFRNKDKPTNILTFAYAHTPQVQSDLVLCMPVARREAREAKKPLDHHLAHLVVHGVLHACGMDHDSNAAADQMEALEAGILRRFRIPNPYSGSLA